jgi:queuine tRNA-ribosyltransferase
MALRTLRASRTSYARLGLLETKDGIVETPAFVAVATNAALKAVDLRLVPGLDMLFCNTYHLLLHPGTDVIAECGGLNSFMNTDKVIMTDSGGFQVFSLKYGTVQEELGHTPSLKKASGSMKSRGHGKGHASAVRVMDTGVTFRSYRDGTRLELTPEVSVTAQKELNGSIIMPLDELPPYHVTREELVASVSRTHRWQKQSLETHHGKPNGQLMYGIVHGGSDKELRKESVKFVTDHGFDGFAIGGALGKNSAELCAIVDWTMGACGLRAAARDTHRPVHVLGIADPCNIRELVKMGCDSFDACYATKISRHGAMLCGDVRQPGRISIKSSRYKHAHHPLPDCHCSTCAQYSLAYLHHLTKANEPLVDTLLSVHNLTYMTDLMKALRDDIKAGQI